MKLLILLLLSTSCGAAMSVTPSDSRLIPYYQMFKMDAVRFNVPLPEKAPLMVVVEKFNKPNIIGLCNHTSYVVSIREDILKNPKQLRMLMYHELGHCMLDRDHTSKKIGQIMSPTVASAYTEDRWEKLIFNFFKGVDK